MKVEMQLVEVKPRYAGLFPQNKTVGNKLCGRTIIRHRGRKFVFWQPWKVELVQNICTYHGLNLEEELTNIFIEELERETQDASDDRWTAEEIADAQKKAAELMRSIKWE